MFPYGDQDTLCHQNGQYSLVAAIASSRLVLDPGVSEMLSNSAAGCC